MRGPVRARVVVAWLVAVTTVAAACGGQHRGAGTSPPTTLTLSPADAEARAELVAFHLYDFPARWTSQPVGSGGYKVGAEVAACAVGPGAAGTVLASHEDYWTQGPGRAVASFVEVLSSEQAAAERMGAVRTPAFVACFRDRLARLVASLHKDRPLRTDVSVGVMKLPALPVDAVGYEVLAQSEGGGANAYLSFVFLRHDRALAVLNFYAVNLQAPLRDALIASIADRLEQSAD